jgi:signal transduction histidine kinase
MLARMAFRVFELVQRQAGETAGTEPAAGTPAQDLDARIHDQADRWWVLEHELNAFDGEVPDGDTRAEEQGEIARELADTPAATLAGARRKAGVKLKSGCAGQYEKLGDSALVDLVRLEGEA